MSASEKQICHKKQLFATAYEFRPTFSDAIRERFLPPSEKRAGRGKTSRDLKKGLVFGFCTSKLVILDTGWFMGLAQLTS